MNSDKVIQENTFNDRLDGQNKRVPHLLNVRDVAVFTGLSEASIRWHLRHKRLKHIRLGRRILFDPLVVMKDLQKLSK